MTTLERTSRILASALMDSISALRSESRQPISEESKKAFRSSAEGLVSALTYEGMSEAAKAAVNSISAKVSELFPEVENNEPAENNEPTESNQE